MKTVRVKLHCRPEIMTQDDTRATFDHFTAEYAQALQAFQTIETQAPTLMLMGHHDELRGFLDQFMQMAERTRAEAAEKNESHFADWFAELIEKARKIRAGVPQ